LRDRSRTHTRRHEPGTFRRQPKLQVSCSRSSHVGVEGLEPPTFSLYASSEGAWRCEIPLGERIRTRLQVDARRPVGSHFGSQPELFRQEETACCHDDVCFEFAYRAGEIRTPDLMTPVIPTRADTHGDPKTPLRTCPWSQGGPGRLSLNSSLTARRRTLNLAAAVCRCPGTPSESTCSVTVGEPGNERLTGRRRRRW